MAKILEDISDVDMFLMIEDIDNAYDLIRDTAEDMMTNDVDAEPDVKMSDEEILTYLERVPFTSKMSLQVIGECANCYRNSMILCEDIINEDNINEGLLSTVLSKIGSGLLAAGGVVTNVLTGPYGLLVTSLGLSAATKIFRNIKQAAARKDKQAVDDAIRQAEAEIAAAKQNGSLPNQQNTQQQPQSPPKQQTQAV